MRKAVRVPRVALRFTRGYIPRPPPGPCGARRPCPAWRPARREVRARHEGPARRERRGRRDDGLAAGWMRPGARTRRIAGGGMMLMDCQW